MGMVMKGISDLLVTAFRDIVFAILILMALAYSGWVRYTLDLEVPQVIESETVQEIRSTVMGGPPGRNPSPLLTIGAVRPDVSERQRSFPLRL